VANLERVLAVELLAAAQALDLRRPLRSSPPLEELHARLRARVAPWDADRYAAADMEAAREVLVTGIDDLLARLA
jgi:histidine ammonia-lyase